MRAATTVAAHTLSFDEIDAPVRGQGEALVRIGAVSLCGTDLHIYHDHFPIDLPIIQGHEMAGVVVEADEEGIVAVGDRVAVNPVIACGTCRACRRGRSNVCQNLSVLGCYEDGGFVEILAVPAGRLHPVPDELPLDVAALGEPASISLQAVARAESEPGDVALVLGCGPIGLLAALALSERGVTVIAADTDAGRVALAEKFGVTHALQVGAGFPDAEQRALLDGLSDSAGPDLIIEATGVPASLENAIRLIAPAGRIVQVGISTQAANITIKDITDKEIDLRGSRNSLELIPEGMSLLARNPLAAQALITHTFGFDDLAAAFETMADRTIPTAKIVIRLTDDAEVAA